MGKRSSRENQKHFNTDLVKMMVSCNMQWNTLDNPVFRQFLQNCIDGNYSNVIVPAEGTIRTGYLLPACRELEMEISSQLCDKHIWVTVHEINDVAGRNTIHVLVGGMQEAGPMRALLIASKIIDEITCEVISEFVDCSLRKLWRTDLEKNRGRVLLYITGSTSYMIASAEYLKNKYKYNNLLHVTCLMQRLQCVARSVRSHYPAVDKLITSVKKMFLKEPFRKRIFQDELPNAPLPPTGSTWLEAASYYYINFDGVKRVIDGFNAKDGLAISHAQEAFNDPNVREDLNYIHSHFSRIYLSIKNLDVTVTSPRYSISDALNIIFDLRNFICQLPDVPAKHVRNEFETVLENIKGFTTLCRIADLIQGKEVDFSQPDVIMLSLKNYMYFRYAPVTSVNVEKLLSSYKCIFKDKQQNLAPEHLEQLLLIFYNSIDD